MTIKTNVKAGIGGWGNYNHNETIAVRSDVKARGLSILVLLVLAMTMAVPTAARPPQPGERQFLPPITVGSAEVAKKIIAADFNRDGKSDFAVLHWEIEGRGTFGGRAINKGFLVRVFLNITPAPTPNPIFTESAQLWYDDNGVRTYPMYNNDLTAADVNGDGKLDLLIANAHADRVFVYPGKGDGTFFPPGEVPTEDDPCYLAAGDFNGDGKTDLALHHFVRSIPGGKYASKFSFLFGKGDATFGGKVVRDEGTFSFPPPNRGPGPFFYSDGWSFAVAPMAVRMRDNSLRDGVWVGDRLAFFTNKIEGDFNVGKRFVKPFGSSLVEPSNLPLVAEFGGRVIFTRVNKLGDITLNKYDAQLDDAFVDADGNSRLFHFGTAVVLSDFDADGSNDLALLSNERGGPGGLQAKDHSAFSFFVAYGIGSALNPLDLANAGFDVTRFREIPRHGLWWNGHRPPQVVAADFNLDEYPDLLTLTAGGIDIHPNAGLWGIDIIPPVLDDISGLGAHPGGGTAWKDPLVLFGRFAPAGFQTVTMLVRTAAPPKHAVAVTVQPDPSNPQTRLLASLPPDDLVTPGDYTLSVWSGAAESFNRISVKVVARPIRIDGVSFLSIPENGKSFARLKVRGFFFGRKDRGNTQFVLEALPPATGTVVLSAIEPTTPEEATLSVPISTKSGQYVLKVENPQRGMARSNPIVVPDYTPTLDAVSWYNPRGTGWLQWPAVNGPVHPGAQFELSGRFYRAPDLDNWLLVRGGLIIAHGVGNVVARGLKNDNEKSYYVFTIPQTLSAGLVELQIQKGGRISSSVILRIEMPTGGGGSLPCTGPNAFFFAVEGKAAPHLCETWAIKAKDKTEADRCIRAKYVVPDDYVFTKIEASETATACNWDWVYDLLEADESLKETITFDAASREIADAHATSRAPTGGRAVYKAGPVK